MSTCAAPTGLRLGRRGFLAVSLISLISLILWLGYLSVMLAVGGTARNWQLAWIGLDAAEVTALLSTTWAAWRARQLLIPAALITGTLLLVDAWFDVVLSWGTDQERLSVLTAVLIEIPLAALFWIVAIRLGRFAIQELHERLGFDGVPPRLYQLPLLAPETVRLQTAAGLSRPVSAPLSRPGSTRS